MSPSYVALPFIASALFFGAALPPMIAIGQASSVTAMTLGALWLLFLIGMLRDNPTFTPVVAGVAALLLSGAIGGWVAGQAAWSPPVGRMTVILATMGVLAAFNMSRIFRDKGKR